MPALKGTLRGESAMYRSAKNKVVIIGAGNVGSTYAYSLLLSGAAQEIVLVDVNRELAEGNAMDLQHSLFFTPPASVKAGGYEDCENADIILITAGTKQKPGQTRLDLASTNSYLVRDIVRKITRFTEEAVLLIVTNPVDLMTYVALKESGFAKQYVIGSGTLLDSARLRYFLSERCNVDTRNIHGMVLGEHGDSELIAWSLSHVGGVPLDQFFAQCSLEETRAYEEEVAERVRNSAYHVIEAKGFTNYAVSQALVRITTSILRNERSILTVSTLLEGEYGIHDVCLSVPAVVGRNGLEHIVTADLAPEEAEALRRSAAKLRKMLDGLE